MYTAKDYCQELNEFIVISIDSKKKQHIKLI